MSDASCQRMKLLRLEFEDNCLRSASVFSRSPPHLFRKPPNLLLGLREGYIDWKGIFRRDGFAHPVRHNWIVVDAACELVKAIAVATEVVFEIRQFKMIEIADCMNSNCLHPAFGDLADTGDATHRQRKKKVDAIDGMIGYALQDVVQLKLRIKTVEIRCAG